MTLAQQVIALKIGNAAGAAERSFQRAIGADWETAYVADWRVSGEIYDLAAAPARHIEFLGLCFIPTSRTSRGA